MNLPGKIRQKYRLIRQLVDEYGDQVQRQTGKSKARQVAEILRYRLRGFKEQQYYILRLYLEERPDFMSNRDFRQRMQEVNPQISGMVEFNKWIFFHYMKSHGLPVPECHGVYHADYGYSPAGSLQDPDRLATLIEQHAPVVIKPVAGGRGESVMVIETVQPGPVFVRASGAEMSLGELGEILAAESHAWLIQDKIHQHQAISELYPNAINTCRVITLRDKSGAIRILAAIFRIGVGGGEIDNTSGGGLAAWVEDGVLGKLFGESSHEGLSQHPDTGAQIEGFRLPWWQETLDLCRQAHQSLPFARTFGWDIALTDTGPIILETNGYWYQDHIQKLGGRSLHDTAFADA